VEVGLQPAAAVAAVARVAAVAAVRQEMELMALVLVFLDQVEQAELAFPTQFLVIIVEMPRSMVRVVMAEQTGPLDTSLEQAVQQIQVKVVEEELPHPLSHQTPVVSLLWVEKEDPV